MYKRQVQIYTEHCKQSGNNYCYICIKGTKLSGDMSSRYYFATYPERPMTCHNENLYDMNILLTVAKATNMSNIIQLFFNEKPDVLGIRYRVGTIGVFKCYVAPLRARGEQKSQPGRAAPAKKAADNAAQGPAPRRSRAKKSRPQQAQQAQANRPRQAPPSQQQQKPSSSLADMDLEY